MEYLLMINRCLVEVEYDFDNELGIHRLLRAASIPLDLLKDGFCPDFKILSKISTSIQDKGQFWELCKTEFNHYFSKKV